MKLQIVIFFDIGHDLFLTGCNEFIQARLQPLAERKVLNPQGQVFPIIGWQSLANNLAESLIG